MTSAQDCFYHYAHNLRLSTLYRLQLALETSPRVLHVLSSVWIQDTESVGYLTAHIEHAQSEIDYGY